MNENSRACSEVYGNLVIGSRTYLESCFTHSMVAPPHSLKIGHVKKSKRGWQLKSIAGIPVIKLLDWLILTPGGQLLIAMHKPLPGCDRPGVIC
jgi:hypothetical protein